MSGDLELADVIDPAEIAAQREKGWPDFHPETYCHQCGRRNPVWWVEPALWDQTRGDDYVTILCPSCFAFAWERRAGGRIIWELRPDMRTGAIRRGEVEIPQRAAAAYGPSVEETKPQVRTVVGPDANDAFWAYQVCPRGVVGRAAHERLGLVHRLRTGDRRHACEDIIHQALSTTHRRSVALEDATEDQAPAIAWDPPQRASVDQMRVWVVELIALLHDHDCPYYPPTAGGYSMCPDERRIREKVAPMVVTAGWVPPDQMERALAEQGLTARFAAAEMLTELAALMRDPADAAHLLGAASNLSLTEAML